MSQEREDLIEEILREHKELWERLAMPDLEKIKERLAAYPKQAERPVVDLFAHAPSDISSLVGEVERLNAENDLMGKMLIERGCDEPIAEVVRLGDRIEELEAERLREERDKARIDAVNFGMQITAMAGEIVKLYRALELSEVGLIPSDVEEADDDLQSCGHPRSAIVSHHDLGGDCTNYCGMCIEESKDVRTTE